MKFRLPEHPLGKSMASHLDFENKLPSIEHRDESISRKRPKKKAKTLEKTEQPLFNKQRNNAHEIKNTHQRKRVGKERTRPRKGNGREKAKLTSHYIQSKRENRGLACFEVRNIAKPERAATVGTHKIKPINGKLEENEIKNIKTKQG